MITVIIGLEIITAARYLNKHAMFMFGLISNKKYQMKFFYDMIIFVLELEREKYLYLLKNIIEDANYLLNRCVNIPYLDS